MIITISGQIGAGKTIIGKELAKRLNYRYVSMGEICKKIASEKGMSLSEFLEYRKKTPEIDHQIDEKQRRIRGNCVLDSRLGFYFSKANLKIWFKAPLEVRIKRISIRDNLPEEEARKQILKRWETDKKIYKKLYSIDIENYENYDLIIDTDKFDMEKIIKVICDLVK